MKRNREPRVNTVSFRLFHSLPFRRKRSCLRCEGELGLKTSVSILHTSSADDLMTWCPGLLGSLQNCSVPLHNIIKIFKNASMVHIELAVYSVLIGVRTKRPPKFRDY